MIENMSDKLRNEMQNKEEQQVRSQSEKNKNFAFRSAIERTNFLLNPPSSLLIGDGMDTVVLQAYRDVLLDYFLLHMGDEVGRHDIDDILSSNPALNMSPTRRANFDIDLAALDNLVTYAEENLPFGTFTDEQYKEIAICIAETSPTVLWKCAKEKSADFSPSKIEKCVIDYVRHKLLFGELSVASLEVTRKCEAGMAMINRVNSETFVDFSDDVDSRVKMAYQRAIVNEFDTPAYEKIVLCDLSNAEKSIEHLDEEALKQLKECGFTDEQRDEVVHCVAKYSPTVAKFGRYAERNPYECSRALLDLYGIHFKPAENAIIEQNTNSSSNSNVMSR